MKKYWVIYTNNFHGEEADELISDGLSWHGKEWWDEAGHSEVPFKIESEHVEAGDMDDNISRLKISISFDLFSLSLLKDIMGAGVPERLVHRLLYWGHKQCDLTKRYFLFAYDGFYPSGAFDDLVITGDDLEGIEEMRELHQYAPHFSRDFYEIWDMETSTKIREVRR